MVVEILKDSVHIQFEEWPADLPEQEDLGLSESP
jgi:hypothetical protein